MKKRVLIRTGFSLLILSAILLLISSSNITGFAILNNATKAQTFYISLILFIIGLVIIFMAERKLEVRVYDSSRGKDSNHERAYKIEDTMGELGGSMVTLGEFRRTIESFKRENGGEALVDLIREKYGPGLRSAVESGDLEKKRVAEAFLNVLGERVEEKVESYRLNKEQRAEIVTAFRTFRGHGLTKEQSRVLDNYGIVYYHKGGRHPKLVHQETGRKIPLASSPSEYWGAQNLAHAIIRFIENVGK